jgi:hypothetical protein
VTKEQVTEIMADLEAVAKDQGTDGDALVLEIATKSGAKLRCHWSWLDRAGDSGLLVVANYNGPNLYLDVSAIESVAIAHDQPYATSRRKNQGSDQKRQMSRFSRRGVAASSRRNRQG